MLSITELQAAKQAYEMCGGSAVLQEPTTICNALDDFLGKESKKVKNQVRMAMDAGLGTMVKSQLETPTADFKRRVTEMLEDNGMSPEAAYDMYRLFGYMTGYDLGAQSESGTGEKKTSPQPKTPPQSKIPPQPQTPPQSKTPPQGEIPSDTFKNLFGSVIDTQEQKKAKFGNLEIPSNAINVSSIGAAMTWIGGIGSFLASAIFPLWATSIAIFILGWIFVFVGWAARKGSYGKVTATGNKQTGVTHFIWEHPQNGYTGIVVNKKWYGFADPGTNDLVLTLPKGRCEFSVVAMNYDSVTNTCKPKSVYSGVIVL